MIKLGRQKIRVKEKIYKEKESDERNIPNREVNCVRNVLGFRRRLCIGSW